MSDLLVNTIKKADGTGSLTVPAESGTVVTTASPSLGRRNLIINGAMQVAQRGSSDSANSNGFGVDRFKGSVAAMDNLVTSYTQESPTDLPGFTNSLRVTISTPESALASDELLRMLHYIEGQNCQGFKYGTSSAESVTLSFWVKGSVTGTYAVSVYCDASAGSRAIGSTYTINSANTWEYKTITFVGDTVRAIDNDNSEGFRINWILSAGSNFTSTDNTSWGTYSGGKLAYGHTANTFVTTTNATWNITGVQLEVGSVATPFEHRSYGEELALCQRYYEVIGDGADDSFATIGMGYYYGSTSVHFPLRFAVKKRIKTYSLDSTSGTNYYSGYRAGGMDDFNNFNITRRRPEACLLYNNSETSGTVGSGFEIVLKSASAFVAIDAEL